MINLGKVRLLIFALLIIVATEGVYAQENSYDLLWNYATNSQVNSISISPDGSYIAAGTSNGEVHFFNKDGKLLWNYTRGNDVTGISISSKGSHLALASKNNIYVLSKEKKLLWSYDIGPFCDSYWECKFTDVSVTSDGSYVVAGSNGYGTSNSYFYNQEGNLIWNYTFPSEGWGSVYSSVSLNGPYIAIAEANGVNNLYLLNKEMEVLWNYTLDTGSTSISISSDASYIAVGCRNEKIYFFNQQGKFLWSYPIDHNIGGVSLSSDGSYVAVGANDGIYLFSKDAELLWKNTTRYVDCISVSSDGLYITAGTNDKVYLFKKTGSSSGSNFVSGEIISSPEKYNSEPIFEFPSNPSEYLKGINEGTTPMVEFVPFTSTTSIKTEEDREKFLEVYNKEINPLSNDIKEDLANIYFEYAKSHYENGKYEEAKICALVAIATSEAIGDTDLIDKIDTLIEEINNKIEKHEQKKLKYELILALVAALAFGYLLEKKMKKKSYTIILIIIMFLILFFIFYKVFRSI